MIIITNIYGAPHLPPQMGARGALQKKTKPNKTKQNKQTKIAGRVNARAQLNRLL